LAQAAAAAYRRHRKIGPATRSSRQIAGFQAEMSAMPPLEPLCALCSKTAGDLQIPALQRCSGCKAAFYCCQEHQKHDWAKHKKVCRPRPCQAGKREIAESSSPCFNIVEIQPNVKVKNGTSCIASPMNNLKFADRKSALNFLQQTGFTWIIPKEGTPFIQLMGFEVDLYGKCAGSSDSRMNGTCVYLTVALESGLSPHACGMAPEPSGVFFAVPTKQHATVLTCDCLWGMRQVILEVLNTDYDINIARKLCQKFKDGLWTPTDGNPNCLKFYVTRPEDCVSGETRTVDTSGGNVKPNIPAHKLMNFQRDSAAWAQKYVSSVQKICDSDPDDEGGAQGEHEVVADFINEHLKNLPSREAVQAYLKTKVPQYCSPYYHDEVQRLFQAGALSFEQEEEQCQKIRQIGQELNYLGGMEAMRAAYYAVNHILCAKDFLGVHIESQDDFPILASWNSHIGSVWDGIGDWAA